MPSGCVFQAYQVSFAHPSWGPSLVSLEQYSQMGPEYFSQIRAYEHRIWNQKHTC